MFKDAWLRGKDNFRVEENYVNRAGISKVSDLFISGERCWDDQKVYNFFQSCDANAILATPIPKNQRLDRLAWMHSANGQYSVKTGYQYWHNQFSTCKRLSQSEGWSKLWKANVPHKTKLFLWRFCRNNLPVRYSLRRRGVCIPITCPMCNTDVEHVVHVFFDCEFANTCWEHAGLKFDMNTVESAADWLLQKFASEPQEVSDKIATTLWGIWYARNAKVWDNKYLTPALTIEGSTRQVTEWQEAQKKIVRNRSSGSKCSHSMNVKWQAPDIEKLKLNVDASVFVGHSSFAVGMIIRDHNGCFIQAKNLRRAGEVPVFEAEAMGILEALSWLQTLALSDVVIESDSLLTVNALHQNIDSHLEVGSVLQDCRDILDHRPDFSVSFTRKQANKAAHVLARVPCSVNSSNVFQSPPPVLLGTLMYDSSLI